MSTYVETYRSQTKDGSTIASSTKSKELLLLLRFKRMNDFPEPFDDLVILSVAINIPSHLLQLMEI